MATRVRLKRYRSIQSLYPRFSVVAYFCLFSFFFLVCLCVCVLSIPVLVARAAVTHFPSAHTYTQQQTCARTCTPTHRHHHLIRSSNPFFVPTCQQSYINNDVMRSPFVFFFLFLILFIKSVIIRIYSTIGR